jgi:hypothetical protein
MLVLTGLLLAGWGLIAGPSNQLAGNDSEASLWGAKYAATSSSDSWN